MSNKDEKEWFAQAEYDMDVAEYLHKGGKYIYAVFMCHLSIEKALKAVYCKVVGEEPPKIHNLTYFLNKFSMKPPQEIYDFLFMLSGLSVATRYPNELRSMSKDYDDAKTRMIITKSKEVLQWAKENL